MGLNHAGPCRPPSVRRVDFLLSTAGIPMGFLSRRVTQSVFSELILDETWGMGKRGDEWNTFRGGTWRLREVLDFKISLKRRKRMAFLLPAPWMSLPRFLGQRKLEPMVSTHSPPTFQTPSLQLFLSPCRAPKGTPSPTTAIGLTLPFFLHLIIKAYLQKQIKW